MNRVLKYAWYQLIVILAAIILMAATVGIIFIYWRGKEFNALILFWPLILLHFYRVFFPLKSGEIAFDERDETIMRRATRTSFISTWYLFALGGLVPILVIGNGSIHVMYYGWLVFFLAILLRMIWSIAVIVQYGRTGSEDNFSEVVEGGAA
jgi:hypothetical protein